MQRTVCIETEFKFSIRDHDALGGSKARCLGVQTQGDCTNALSHFLADFFDDMRKVHILIMQAHLGFGGRSKKRLGQFAGLFKTCRQLNPADRACGLIIFPARANQITTCNCLDHNGLEALDHDSTSDDLITLIRCDHILGVDPC